MSLLSWLVYHESCYYDYHHDYYFNLLSVIVYENGECSQLLCMRMVNVVIVYCRCARPPLSPNMYPQKATTPTADAFLGFASVTSWPTALEVSFLSMWFLA